MVVVDGGEAGERRIETQQEQPGEQAPGQESNRSSKRQRVRQEEEQLAGVVRGSWRPSAGIRWDYKTKQNKTKPVFCRIFLYKYNFAIPTKFYLEVSTMVI